METTLYTIEIFFLLIIQIVFLLLWIKILNNFTFTFLIFIVAAVCLGYIEFSSYAYKRPGYDEQRVPLVYPYELIDGESGCYLNSVKNMYPDPEIFFTNGEFNFSNNHLYFKSNNRDSGSFEINLATLKKTNNVPRNLEYFTFEELHDKHENSRTLFILTCVMIEALLCFLGYLFMKRYRERKARKEKK
ncbi:MAG: hypothetical protein MUC87_18955 [Bacteroidia bacterium]|jgi:hypothetical protein|nr:hypothetical protein [Bacteroidia bacterium]